MEVVAEVEWGEDIGMEVVEEEVVVEEEAEAKKVEKEVVVVVEVEIVEEEEVVWFSDRSSPVAQSGLELTLCSPCWPQTHCDPPASECWNYGHKTLCPVRCLCTQVSKCSAPIRML